MKAKLAIGIIITVIASYALLTMGSEDAIASEGKSDKVFAIKDVKKATGKKLHDFSFEKDGVETYLSDISKNKVVFLNFWGTWCPPCRKEIPAIIKLQKEYKDELMVIGIALERGGELSDQIKKVDSYANKADINYINFIETSDQKYGRLFGGIRAVPTTFIINKNGEVVEQIRGGMDYASFEKLVKKYI